MVESKAPPLPKLDGRVWHELTIKVWKRAWASEMASRWLAADADALGRLAILWDDFYKTPESKTLAEIRLQEQRFGFSPLDRSRLQWEIGTSAAEPARPALPTRRVTHDPRRILQAVK